MTDEPRLHENNNIKHYNVYIPDEIIIYKYRDDLLIWLEMFWVILEIQKSIEWQIGFIYKLEEHCSVNYFEWLLNQTKNPVYGGETAFEERSKIN